jgi:hypothetical protein
MDSESKAIDVDLFEQFMGELLWEESDMQVLRCKGTFLGRQGDQTNALYMLQGVDEVFEVRKLQEAGDQKCRLLFVGKRID